MNQLLDNELYALSKPWIGTIIFPVFVLNENDVLSKESFNHVPTKVNICDYLGAGRYPSRRLMFSPDKCPPPINDELKPNGLINCQGWIDLKRELQFAAQVSDNPVICNGDNGLSGCRKFNCAHHRV